LLNKGVTIFISSHILGEISKIATRIGIIHMGSLILESGFHDLEKLRSRCLHLKTEDRSGTMQMLQRKGLNPEINENGIIEIRDHKPVENPSSVASMLVMSGYPPSLLKVEEEDIEDFFLRVVSAKGCIQ